MTARVDWKTLRPLLRPEVFELDGCVFLRGAASPKLYRAYCTGEGKPDRGHVNRTGFEAFENHVHMVDRVAPRPSKPSAADRRAAAWLGQAIVHVWRSELADAFPGQRFRIYCTNENDPIVRFHRCYRGEPSWLDAKVWSKLISRGRLLVLETKGRPV